MFAAFNAFESPLRGRQTTASCLLRRPPDLVGGRRRYGEDAALARLPGYVAQRTSASPRAPGRDPLNAVRANLRGFPRLHEMRRSAEAMRDCRDRDGETMKKSRNLAARAAHWSAEHRKTAIFGWLAFVVVAAFLGNAVGQEDDAGRRPVLGRVGEGGAGALRRRAQAEQRARAHPEQGARRVGDPRVHRDDRGRRCGGCGVRRTSNGALAPDRRGARLRGPALRAGRLRDHRRHLEAADRLEPSKAAVERGPDAHPDLRVEQFGSVSSNKELNETFASDLAQAELLSLPDHPPDPRHRLRRARGGARAAAARGHHGDGGARARRAAEPAVADRQQPVVGDPADRARGQRGLQPVLSAARARGARRRHGASARRSRSPRRRRAAPS